MKKIILISIATLLFISSFIVIRHFKRKDTTASCIVGILQTASHPALDASRNGFIEELKSKMGNAVEFVVYNAQGSIAQVHALAQQFHADSKYKAFFAIATPAAQAMSALEKERPVFIAAVTDPHALGIIHATTNVCGTKDMIDVKAEIEMFMHLVPQVKTVGLLYTAGETNSIALIQQMRLELEKQKLTATDFAVSSEFDMQAVVELACRKVDVILAPTDNTIASTITLITAITLKNKKPLIVSDNMLVKFGALAARGVDYKISGKEVARIAYEVLVEGKKPYELPIEQAKSEKIFISPSTAAVLGLTIPEVLQKYVVLVS